MARKKSGIKVKKNHTCWKQPRCHDSLHPVVQPTGQDPAAEMVRGPLREREEGVLQGPDQQDLGQEAKNVQFPPKMTKKCHLKWLKNIIFLYFLRQTMFEECLI